MRREVLTSVVPMPRPSSYWLTHFSTCSASRIHVEESRLGRVRLNSDVDTWRLNAAYEYLSVGVINQSGRGFCNFQSLQVLYVSIARVQRSIG